MIKKDKTKTREQLLHELEKANKRIAELEKSETERKLLKKEFVKTNERLELAMDAGEHGFWDWNLDTNDVYFNPRYNTMLGYKPGELPMRLETWVNLMHPDDKKTIVPEVENYVKNAQSYEVEFRLKTKDGNWRWISGRGKTYKKDKNGIPHRVVGIHVDITEHKQAEETLKKSNENFQQVVSNITVAVWKADIGKNVTFKNTYSSPVLDELLDLPAGTMKNDWDKYFSYIKPEYLEQVNNAFREAIISPDKEIDCEYEVLKDNGQTAWFNSKGRCFEKNGKLHVFGSTIDITKRKLAEKARQKLEEQFRLIAENTSDNISFTTFDLKAKFLYASPSVKSVLGYDPKDLVGRSFFDFIHPEDKKLLFPLLKKYVNLKIKKFLTGKESTISETIEFRFKNKIGNWHSMQSKINIAGNQLLSVTRDITEYKQAEDAVRESENNLHELIENLMDGVAIVDENSKHIYVNFRFSEITGYSKNELLNMTGWDITPHDDRAKLKQRMKDRIASKQVETHYERNILKKDGTEIPVEMSTTVTTWQGKKRPMAIIHDISGRKRTEEAFLESEMQLQTLIDAMPDFVCFKDVNGRWLKANNASIRIFNLKDIDYRGKNDSELLELNSELQDTFLTCKETDARCLEAGALVHGEEIIPDSDGSIRFFDVTKVPVFHSDDERNGIVVIGHDITERKKVEEQLENYSNSLEETVKQRTADIENQSKKLEESQLALTFLLEDVNDARNELENTNLQLKAVNSEMESFTYSVSHDLRAPLRAILGFSKKFTDIYEKKVDEEGKRLLNVINGNTKKMGMLIDDLLDFSRIGRTEMRKVKVDIKGLVNETWNEQKNQFADRKIELNIKELPMANGDRNMLRQVLFNLLSNAAKFSRNKTISKIEVGAKEEESEIKYYVKDNGVGFDMKYIDKLFQVFQRLHSDREFEGTGVGLAIVQRVIDRHGGKVWAISTINRGATIYFSLPK